MPLYDYKCSSCSAHLADVLQSIKDEPLRDCPVCHTPTLERIIGSTSFVLQGSGWARDMYGSSKPAPKASK